MRKPSNLTQLIFFCCGFSLGFLSSHVIWPNLSLKLPLPTMHGLNKSSFTCHSSLGTFVTSNNNAVAEGKQVAQIMPLNEEIGIEIHGQQLTLRDNYAEEDKRVWQVSMNSEDILMATASGSQATASAYLESALILDKNTGYGTYSRTDSNVYINRAITNQAYFISCQ